MHSADLTGSCILVTFAVAPEQLFAECIPQIYVCSWWNRFILPRVLAFMENHPPNEWSSSKKPSSPRLLANHLRVWLLCIHMLHDHQRYARAKRSSSIQPTIGNHRKRRVCLHTLPGSTRRRTPYQLSPMTWWGPSISPIILMQPNVQQQQIKNSKRAFWFVLQGARFSREGQLVVEI